MKKRISDENRSAKFFVKLLVICLVTTACGAMKKRLSAPLDEKPQIHLSEKAIDLRLDHEKGFKEVHKYHVTTITRNFDQSQILREKEEVVDFSVQQTVTDKKAGETTVRIEILEKKGVIDLHDLIMPRPGEKLIVRLNDKGKVLSAGDYAKTSAFYLSPISLPEEPVKVGDTWFLEERWINEKSGMPMKIELVSILKNLYERNGELFAEIETSGQIIIPEEVFAGLIFTSQIVGRIVLAVKTGTVAWSEIRNSEKLEYPDATLEVLSCMESKLMEPNGLSWPWAVEPACDPTKDFVYAIPGN